MKKYLFTLIALFHFAFANAQNLVPNWSFEDTTSCPDFFGFSNVSNWYRAEGIPYYYNACNTSPAPNNCSVPHNYLGTRSAATGFAYCNIVNFVSWTNNTRDKIGVQLLDTLITGKRYKLSFMVASVSCWRNSLQNGATNNLGFLFSTFKYDLSNPSPTANFCHFKADSILKDTIGWELVSGSFIADSAYLYLTIGNFYTDSLTDTLRFFYQQGNPIPLRSLIFIDDVIVAYDTSQDLSNYTKFDNTLFKIYPNPASTMITIEADNQPIQAIELYNSLGKLLIREDNMVVSHIQKLNTSIYPTGFYLLKIKTKNKTITQKINIIH